MEQRARAAYESEFSIAKKFLDPSPNDLRNVPVVKGYALAHELGQAVQVVYFLAEEARQVGKLLVGAPFFNLLRNL